MSKKLTQARRNYTVTKQKRLAAIQAVKKFRMFADGAKFVADQSGRKGP